jgi:enoyl-CoA hydratase/carnithine racemase
VRREGDETVIRSESGGIVTIILNRPPANALDNATLVRLRELFVDLAAEEGRVRGVILTGAGTLFCAGGDIKELDALTPELGIERIRSFHAIIAGIEYLDAPVSCAVNGDAVGGGMELCLFADYRIAVETARFGLPEINHGLLPAARSIQQAVRVLGLREARRLMFGGGLIDAREALRIGLVDAVARDRGELLERAREWASAMAGKPRDLFGPLKRTMQLTGCLSNVEAEEMTISDFRRYFQSEAVREQMRSVLARWKRRRSPQRNGEGKGGGDE